MHSVTTIPCLKRTIAKLGPRPNDNDVINAWSELLDSTLRGNNYGDLSADGKFDEWLTRLYINGQADYEDINGEGGDALGAWKALSIRGKLRQEDQDFNKFKSIKQLQRIRNDPQYRNELSRIKDQEHINKMKREAKEVVILDNDRFRAIVPLNYGSCYSTDKGGGYIPNFCTGSSSGASWFSRYAPDGLIVNIVDKNNIEDVNGKWQFHAATNQIVRGDQERRHDVSYNDGRFAELFPGLMKEIIAGLKSHAEEIKAGSTEITPGGYDVNHEIDLIKSKYPKAVSSGEKEEEPNPETENDPDIPAADAAPEDNGPGDENPNDQPGTWRVVQTASGRSANIQGDNLAHVQQRVLQRYPDSSIEDYSWERV